MRGLRSPGGAELEIARAVSSLKSASELPSNDLANGTSRMASIEEPDRKKRSGGNLVSPPLKKQVVAAMNEEKKVDPAVLQFQNQKLVQQLDVQKQRIQDLEAKLDTLQQKQAAYDSNLSTVNRVWGQLIDDLGILAVRANSPLNGSNGVSGLHEDRPGDDCPSSGDLFLNRLLNSCPSIGLGEDCEAARLLERALEERSSQTVKVLKCVINGIDQQRLQNEETLATIRKNCSEADVLRVLESNEASLRKELEGTRTAIDELHVKHRSLLSEVALLRDLRVRQQGQIRDLTDQLDEAQSQLEGAKKKLSSWKLQQEQQQQGGIGGSCPATPRGFPRSESVGNGLESRARAEEHQQLKASLAEVQALAARRLTELEAKQQDHLTLLQKLQTTEAALRDEQRIKSSRPYVILAERLAAVAGELERFKGVVDHLHRERTLWLVKEREMVFRAESGDLARRSCLLAEARIHDLQMKMQQCAAERDALQHRVEELQASGGRGDTVEELKVMVATLHKEIALLQGEVKTFKELAAEVPAVKAENLSLQEILLRKAIECNDLRQRCADAAKLVKQRDTELRASRGTELELRLFVEMYARESLDRREVREVKAAEVRALAQVEQLKGELDEHSLALRVKAANEAEAVCQQRLMAAESEISRLRLELIDAERRVTEAELALKSRAEEGEVYVTEIETIGQAYEEMQSQNRRLLQQITERDEYNTQLMAESVKAKQLQVSLLAEKGEMEARMQHGATSAGVDRQRVLKLEEQVKGLLEQLEKTLEESRRVQAEAEGARRMQGEAERESSILKKAALEAQNDLEEREKRILEAEQQLEKERFKRRRVEEEREAQARKLAKVESQERAVSHSQVEALQEEVTEYKALLKCSVCHDRRKEVVITKCFHLFCSPCIQRNLELRHRKCPGCGIPFGQGDVRTIYM